MGQVCTKTSKQTKCIRLEEIPVKNGEEEVIHEKKPFVEQQAVEVHDEKIENEVTIVPIQTLPEMVENKNPPSNHQLSNSFASYNSLSNLEVDEGDDKCHPLKMFFQD